MKAAPSSPRLLRTVPQKCSGLDVVRYDAAGIARELGTRSRLVDERRETHVTPWGAEQRFVYARFVRVAP